MSYIILSIISYVHSHIRCALDTLFLCKNLTTLIFSSITLVSHNWPWARDLDNRDRDRNRDVASRDRDETETFEILAETRPRRDVGTSRDRLETETSRPRPQPWVQGQSPWSGGQGGEAPLKLTIY